ncbi:hypothetical protein GF382_01750 [Candidatus Falkowbacteria bacterium]|nr:hypothetical protein [Candidatus Falkowbacteria bacterium]
MNYFFIILFFAIYLLIARRRLDWAVMFILMALPLYLWRFRILGVPFTVLEGMVLISFFVWLFSATKFKDFIKGKYGLKEYFKNIKKRKAYPFGFSVIIVAVVSLLAVVIAGFSFPALGIWKAYFFEPLLFFILILNIFQDKKGFRKIIFSLSISAFVVSAYAIIQKITGIGISNQFWADAATRRVVSFFGYPNAVGLYLAPIVMLILGYFYKNCNPKRVYENIFFSLTILFSLSAIYFAGSEGALIGVLAALLIFGLFADRISRRITIGFVLAVVLLVSFVQPIREYAFKKTTLMDLSGQIRRQQWQETWEMLTDGRMVQGSGLAGYQQAILPYHSDGIFYDDGSDPDFHRHTVFNAEYRTKAWQPVEIYLYPHNIILNFWTELGLAGALVFLWLFIKALYILFNDFIYRIKNYPKDEICPYVSLGIIGALITMLIHGLVDVPYFKNDLAIIFWTIIALTGLIEIRLDQLKNRKKVEVIE